MDQFRIRTHSTTTRIRHELWITSASQCKHELEAHKSQMNIRIPPPVKATIRFLSIFPPPTIFARKVFLRCDQQAHILLTFYDDRASLTSQLGVANFPPEFILEHGMFVKNWPPLHALEPIKHELLMCADLCPWHSIEKSGKLNCQSELYPRGYFEYILLCN